MLEPIEVDTITQNSNADKNNKVHTQQEKLAHLPLPIMVKGVKDFLSLCSELIDLMDPEN